MLTVFQNIKMKDSTTATPPVCSLYFPTEEVLGARILKTEDRQERRNLSSG